MIGEFFKFSFCTICNVKSPTQIMYWQIYNQLYSRYFVLNSNVSKQEILIGLNSRWKANIKKILTVETGTTSNYWKNITLNLKPQSSDLDTETKKKFLLMCSSPQELKNRKTNLMQSSYRSEENNPLANFYCERACEFIQVSRKFNNSLSSRL